MTSDHSVTLRVTPMMAFWTCSILAWLVVLAFTLGSRYEYRHALSPTPSPVAVPPEGMPITLRLMPNTTTCIVAVPKKAEPQPPVRLAK